MRKLAYWLGGLPVALRSHSQGPDEPLTQLRRRFASNYWQLRGPRRWKRRLALLGWPIWLIRAIIHYTRMNGRSVAELHGRPIALQVTDQWHVYWRHGILPRWYYIFSLYEPGGLQRAASFINRFETKGFYYRAVNAAATSPLGSKLEFARHCETNNLPCVPVLLAARDGQVSGPATELGLPDCDLFIKPIRDRGGKGAQRWNWADGEFVSTGGLRRAPDELVKMLRVDSAAHPRLVQPRMTNHPEIADLSNGALSTMRVLTCLNEHGEPEVIAAVARMAIGANVTVDNIHAGGVAAEIDLATGLLGKASNLGDDVRLGWLTHHPDTGGRIEGREIPRWAEVQQLAKNAHRAFRDWVVIGWDIAVTVEGACLVEGNSGPCVDLMQRPARRGLGGRLAELLEFHFARQQAA